MDATVGSLLMAAAVFCAGCATTATADLHQELADGKLVIVADGEPGSVKTPATYDYAPGSSISLVDLRFDSFAIEADVRAALERQLALLGLGRVRDSNVDYRIGYSVVSKDQSQLTEAVRTMGLPALRGDTARKLPRGSLLLAIYDTKTEKVVWRAAIEGAIDHSRKPADRKARVESIIALLLERLE